MRSHLLLTLFAAAAFSLLSCVPPASGPFEIGQPIPGFVLEKLGGGVIDSEDLFGDEPIVINFWATWCGPCVREIPALQKMHREKGAVIVTIALDNAGAAVVQPFVDEYRIDYPVLLGDIELFSRYGGVAIPYTLVLDGELRLVKAFRGLISHHTLEQAVAKARAA